MGLLVETSGGHLDAVLVKPAAEGRDVLMRMDFDALLRRPDIKLLAVAPPAPALSQLESRCVTQFANQAASLAEPSKRVRILSSRGRKLFVAQLVAELLVAMGRHVQQEDVYRSRQGSWTMPDLTFMTLPNRPSTPPQRKGTPSDKESGVSRPAQRTAQQPSTQVNSRSGSSSGSSSGGRYSASGAGGLVPLDYTQTEPLPVQHPMMHAGSVQVAHGSAFADVLMTSTLSHDQLIAHRISLGSMCSGRLSEGGPFAAACGQGASSRRSSHSPATLVPCHSSGPAHGHVGGLSSSQWCLGSVGSDGGSALMVAISSSTPTNMLQARAVLV